MQRSQSANIIMAPAPARAILVVILVAALRATQTLSSVSPSSLSHTASAGDATPKHSPAETPEPTQRIVAAQYTIAAENYDGAAPTQIYVLSAENYGGAAHHRFPNANKQIVYGVMTVPDPLGEAPARCVWRTQADFETFARRVFGPDRFLRRFFARPKFRNLSAAAA